MKKRVAVRERDNDTTEVRRVCPQLADGCNSAFIITLRNMM